MLRQQHPGKETDIDMPYIEYDYKTILKRIAVFD